MGRGVLVASLLLTAITVNARMNTVEETMLISDNDCYNLNLITNYLTPQLDYSKPFLESEREYEAKRFAINFKIWSLRYNCGIASRVLDTRERARIVRRP